MPCELTLIADPAGFRKATFALSCPGLTVCSAHGPLALVDWEFQIGGAEDPDPNQNPQERVFDAIFGGSSPADLRPEGSALQGDPFFGCGTVILEDVAVACEGEFHGAPLCTSNLTMHVFMHVHDRFGNFIGPSTARFSHGKGGIVEVRVIIPDGEVLIQGVLSPADSIYGEVDEFGEQQNCFTLE